MFFFVGWSIETKTDRKLHTQKKIKWLRENNEILSWEKKTLIEVVGLFFSLVRRCQHNSNISLLFLNFWGFFFLDSMIRFIFIFLIYNFFLMKLFPMVLSSPPPPHTFFDSIRLLFIDWFILEWLSLLLFNGSANLPGC